MLPTEKSFSHQPAPTVKIARTSKKINQTKIHGLLTHPPTHKQATEKIQTSKHPKLGKLPGKQGGKKKRKIKKKRKRN